MTSRPSRSRPIRREGRIFVIAGYAVSIVYSLIILLPLYFLVVSSFKSTGELIAAPLAIPTDFDLANYSVAINQVSLFDAMLISAIVTVGTEVLTLALAVPVSYGIARLGIPSARWLEAFFGLGFLIPAIAVLVPVFLLAVSLGLLNNPLMLILFYPAMRLPISVFILTAYFRQIPKELEESAEIDGAGRVRRIWSIMLPLARPGVVTVAILTFIDIWNEFFFAFILSGSRNQTAQVVLPLLQSEYEVNFGVLAAGSIVTMVPVYFVFIVMQRRITSGLTAGAVEG